MTRPDLVTAGEDVIALERLVDRYGLANVLEGLVHICEAKAEHIRQVWQDDGLAKDWAADARTIARAIDRLRNAFRSAG